MTNENVSISISSGLKFSCVTLYTREDSKLNGDENQPQVNRSRLFSTFSPIENLDTNLETLFEENSTSSVFLTGLNAGKLSKKIQNSLKSKIIVDKDTAQLSIKGCNFLLRNVQDVAFSLNKNKVYKYKFSPITFPFHPYLMVAKGQFIEFFKVCEDESSPMGRSCFNLDQMLGISKGMTGIKDFKEFVFLLKSSPIYNRIMKAREDNFMRTMIEVKYEIFSPGCENGEKSELAWYLFWLWASNVSQLACLHCQNNKIENIIFGEGWELMEECLEILNEFFKFYSGNKIKVFFLRYSGFLSSLGMMIAKHEGDFQLSWKENYILSTGHNEKCQTLVLDSFPTKLVPCPLLKDPVTYDPLVQNLYTDETSRNYWIECVTENVRGGLKNKITKMTAESCTPKHIALYKLGDMAIQKLNYIKDHPYCFGNLSMKKIQDMIEDCKIELKLFDTYAEEKKKEVDLSLQMIERHLKFVDRLNFKERQFQIALSVLAGNMFDWGAKEAKELIESGHFGFKEAVKRLPERPWLIDHLDEWIDQIENKPYKLAAVFVDNYGFDFIIGMIPFVRELIKIGTKVIICANKDPVLNDATVEEVKDCFKMISSICPLLKDAWNKNEIKVLEVPNSSCCLDLRLVGTELAKSLSDVDLLVLEGMGRSIHTNLESEFNVDTLRMGVVKNHWFSKQLGGNFDFAPIFKFTPFICDTHL